MLKKLFLTQIILSIHDKYGTFSGSIQIILYLKYNKDQLTSSLRIYCTLLKMGEQKAAFIYLRKGDIYISNFCFVDIQVEDEFDFVSFNTPNSITVANSFIERKFSDFLNKINTDKVSFYEEDGIK